MKKIIFGLSVVFVCFAMLCCPASKASAFWQTYQQTTWFNISTTRNIYFQVGLPLMPVPVPKLFPMPMPVAVPIPTPVLHPVLVPVPCAFDIFGLFSPFPGLAQAIMLNALNR
ncbi:MAG: hypothetical protein V1753_04865 [Pseudomonadota bacterium]